MHVDLCVYVYEARSNIVISVGFFWRLIAMVYAYNDYDGGLRHLQYTDLIRLINEVIN